MVWENQAQPPETLCFFTEATPKAFGGGVTSWVIKLMQAPEGFHTGLAELSMIFVQLGSYVPASLGNGGTVRDGSNGQRDRWERYIASLPKRRFERKRRRLTFELRGNPVLDYQNAGNSLMTLTRDQLRTGAVMVLDGLRYAQSTLKPADGVDLSAMFLAAEALIKRKWESDEEMQASALSASETVHGRVKAMDPWALIDLSRFHPEARKILDAPSDWSNEDDFSPHGNDLGAQILLGWSKLAHLTPETVAERFEIDIEENSARGSMNRIFLMLALAFGHVKKTGTCPTRLARRAHGILLMDGENANACIAPGTEGAFQKVLVRYTAILEKLSGAAN